MAVDTQELVSIDIKTAKPSDICASQPRDRWCQDCTMKDGDENEPDRFCRIGWLAHVAGIMDPYDDWKTTHRRVSHHYGIPPNIIMRVADANDSPLNGYDEAFSELRVAGY